MTRDRVLVVGLGRFGKNHLRVLGDLGVPLSLCDADPRALEAAARAHPDAHVATDVRDLSGGAFAASVVVPAHAHRAVATLCLDAGLHVFCEKPLAPTTEDALALARLAHEKRLVLQTGFIFRHHPATKALEELIRGGDLGRVRAIQARFVGFKRPRTDGGCALNDAIHFVDLAAHLFGKSATAATAVTRSFLGDPHEDLAFLAFDFGPELLHVEASYHSPDRARSLTVLGDAGSATLDYDASRLALFRRAHRRAEDGSWTAFEVAPGLVPVAAGEPLRLELEDFLANARASRAPAADGWAGARATAALEAALLSAREGRRVSVAAVPARGIES